MGKSAMRKAQKKLAREQAKLQGKHQNKSTNEILGLKSITDHNKKGIGENIGRSLRLGWVFDKWYEKLILVVMGWLALWKLIGFF